MVGVVQKRCLHGSFSESSEQGIGDRLDGRTATGDTAHHSMKPVLLKTQNAETIAYPDAKLPD
jgi:hypothetical protein